MRRTLGAVGLLALGIILIRAASVGLAGDYVDPVGKISAQDEALYAHSAIHMAREGGWLTPTFLGRYALYKPPLLFWMAGASARVFGVSRIALRLPVALLGALTVCFIFLWAAELRSWQCGVCAALLLLSDHPWHVLSAMSMTDGLLVGFSAAAVFCVFSDPWLDSWWSFGALGLAVGCAILTKSIAGVLPLAVVLLYWLAAPPKRRPRLSRVLLAGAWAAVFAAPWFVYQMAVHGRWFWVEHVRVELLGYGAGQPPQTSRENPFLFYGIRLAAFDPVLLALALAAVPRFAKALRQRSPEATLLACWLVVMAAPELVWQYRNAVYLLPLVPPMALLAAIYSPLSGRLAASLIGIALVAKLAFPFAPWGLSFLPDSIQTSAPALSRYCESRRGNELFIVDFADDLYAATLPLPRLRYGLIGAPTADTRYSMPFAQMGIVADASQFNDLAHWEPVFRQRLRDWGLDSAEPIATLVEISSPSDLARLVAAHPQTDFFIPERYRDAVRGAGTHDMLPAPPGYWFLLSRAPVTRAAAQGWSCRL